MQPEIWGKHAWNFIHLVAMGYPDNPTDEDKENYRTFIYSLKNILPCEKCRLNFSSHISQYPLTNEVLSSKTNFLQWTIDLHNIVNFNTGKQMLQYDEALACINQLTKSNNTKNYFLILTIIIVVVLIILLIIWKKLKET